jgi:hypothetical protein
MMGASGLVAGLVAACDEAPQSVAILTWPGIWTFLASATAQGPLSVTVHGTIHPDATAADTFALVGGGIQRAITKRKITVTNGEAHAEPAGFRVVWVLDAPANLNPSRLCDGTPASALVGAPDPERLRMLAAFCVGDDARSAVRGSVARGSGAETKGAERLISQMTRQLVDEVKGSQGD